jgi:hypothetical protein
MATGGHEFKKHGVQKIDLSRAKDPKKELEELEKLEEGQELSQEVAQRLQGNMGNQAIANMVGKGAAKTGGGVELEEEQQVEEAVEVEEEGPEMEGPTHGGSGSGGAGDGAGGAGDPWDVGMLFDGPDDPDDEVGPTRRRTRWRPTRPDIERFNDDDGDWGEAGGLLEEDVAPVDAILNVLGPLGDAARSGDAIFDVVDAALGDPRAIGRRSWDAEDLIDRTGALDPLGRPALIGRFLAVAAAALLARTRGRTLAGPAPALLGRRAGHAGAVARLTALATYAAASEGEPNQTNRAIGVSLAVDAWPAAVSAARKAAARRRLHAPQIALMALEAAGMRADEDDRSGRLPEPSRLGGLGLLRLIPPGFIPPIPPFERPGRPPAPHDDDVMAALDAVMSRMTGGPDPTDTPPDPVVTWMSLEPTLDATEALVNAMGRAQVELAAAAVAVSRVRPGAPVRQTLVHADRALRELARTAVDAADALRGTEGLTIYSAGTVPERAVAALRATAAGLQTLRAWAFETLAGAMDA